MAKTNLIQGLKRAYQIARFAVKQQIPATVARERWETHIISRRRLLQASLAVASGAAAMTIDRQFHQPANATITKSSVLIVGAGIAGLTAAYYLVQAGVPVRIVEASKRTGGRMLSKQNALGTATTIELGGEFIDSGHTNIRKLAKDLGLVEVDLVEVDQGLAPDVWFFNNRLVKEEELIAPFIPFAKQIEQDVAAIGTVNYRSKNPRAKVLDRLSIKDYLERYCPDPLLREFIEVAYVNEYGLEADQQSSINLLILIGTNTTKIEIFGASDQRYHIRGGNQQITNELTKKLSDRIETDTALESIRSTANGRYRVSLRHNGGSKTETFERVILALPFSVLRKIDLGVQLPAAKQSAIKELGYGTNTKVMISYSDRIWRSKYRSNGQSFSDLATSETWETSRYTPGNAGVITNFSGGKLGLKIAKTKPVVITNRLTRQFDQIFPGVQNLSLGKAAISDWLDSPYTRGSYATYLVGQWTKFAGAEGERVGNLFFIGEHCSIEAQGYMEGGCATGVAVATEILQELRK
jgi:monoamine oxidase